MSNIIYCLSNLLFLCAPVLDLQLRTISKQTNLKAMVSLIPVFVPGSFFLFYKFLTVNNSHNFFLYKFFWGWEIFVFHNFIIKYKFVSTVLTSEILFGLITNWLPCTCIVYV